MQAPVKRLSETKLGANIAKKFKSQKDMPESQGALEEIPELEVRQGPGSSNYSQFLDEVLAAPREYRVGDSLNLLSEETKKKPCMLGIDEAGRGPVLGLRLFMVKFDVNIGPMVYACAVAALDSLDKLKKFGLADSKTLTEEQREKILGKLLGVPEDCAYVIHSISPVYITEKMLDICKTSLNVISHDAAINLIRRALDAGVNLQKVYVDTVGKPEPYKAKLKSLYPNLEIHVESKADATYAIVSAASIYAKVSRDRLISNWPKCELGDATADTPTGSGYPGDYCAFYEKLLYGSKGSKTFFRSMIVLDPATKKYLEACIDPIYGFPGIVRVSWATAINLIDKHCVAVSWPDDEENTKKKKAEKGGNKENDTREIASLFSSASRKAFNSNPGTRQRFFKDRGLVHVTEV
ncbi:Ribonuclease H2 subunit A [Cichlidogyrus casuarinus]|uniref:Ribonuclease n=1 Tax=Cichlidogyrus casuarinus TaxID=1844966 RepID=A0ABD2QL26_9PLAT